MMSLTANDLPHVSAVGSSVTGLLDLFNKLREFNFGMNDLMRLGTLLSEIRTAATTKEKVVAALQALKIISAATPTTSDDKILAGAESILSGKTLDLLCNLVDAWLGSRSLALSAVEADVVAAGGNWTTFMELAKLVMTLIRSRQGK